MITYVIAIAICIIVCVTGLLIADIKLGTIKHTREHNIGYYQGTFVATVIIVTFTIAEHF